MKFLFIFLTFVQITSVQAQKNQAVEQVRLSLWYQGIEKEKEDIQEKDQQLDAKKIRIPEELIKALDRI